MADCNRYFHHHHYQKQPPFAFTGPADKYTALDGCNPRDRLATTAASLVKPPQNQLPCNQRSPTVGGPNPGHTVLHRELHQTEGSPTDRLPNEAHWDRFDPRLHHPRPRVADIQAMSREDFARYRDQKDRNPDLVPRAPNILQSNHCETCAFPWANVYGCSKDQWYYTQHPEYRDINKFPRPNTVGWFGYSHEQLDRHNTGYFWGSNKHA
ncbi:hypothetical protein BOX15_Mlig024949g2 [Macrostomum lignano]|uniref:Uncharacterized protein n=1 Tax=Macrostomum lignano TaxID=282301 RepID=A0A267GLW2_9PLAT|nr:hypothetical protein BOX15_Mlig024949g2 [Macrostomum lignano]